MKLTGYQIQHLAREKTTLIETLVSQFRARTKVFPGDPEPHLEALGLQIQKEETALAKLQTIQTRYNLRVEVSVEGVTMPLAEAVKSVGGAGRLEKIWRDLAAPRKDRYSLDRDERQEGTVVAKAAVSSEEALVLSKKAAKRASALREAIQIGNATAIAFDNVPDSLFE